MIQQFAESLIPYVLLTLLSLDVYKTFLRGKFRRH